MLEIVRGRNWAVAHTVLDNEDGPPTDLSIFSEIACQIREKTATRNPRGFFEHRLVSGVEVIADDGGLLYLELSASITRTLHVGDYLLDVVATNADDVHESLLDPEPVKVVNRPSEVNAGSLVVIPDFVEIFETALED